MEAVYDTVLAEGLKQRPQERWVLVTLFTALTKPFVKPATPFGLQFQDQYALAFT